VNIEIDEKVLAKRVKLRFDTFKASKGFESMIDASSYVSILDFAHICGFSVDKATGGLYTRTKVDGQEV
jgi:hypothetical protein